MQASQKLIQLTQLAREKDSERRRELLREVTDFFFEAGPETGSTSQAQFDAVLSAIAKETGESGRAELAERFADAPNAPHGLVLQLARDAIAVAGPILQRSQVLSDEDLIDLVRETTQAHMKAISRREEVSEKVSEAIVEHGDDDTIAVLVRNDGAKLSRTTFEAVTRRAETSRTLQGPLVDRHDTPADLLNDLMMVVEAKLREKILQRFDDLEPGVLEAALAASHDRLANRIAEDREVAEAQKFVRAKKLRNQLDGSLLASLLREGEITKFCVAFADMTGVDYHTARRAYEAEDVDALTLVSKAAGLEKTLFVTIAVLRAGAREDAFSKASELGKIYDALDTASAQRALRFMKARRAAAA